MTSCLLDYIYFNKYHKKIAINLSKQTSAWCWPKSNTTNFTENLARNEKANTTIFFIIEEKNRVVNFLKD